MRSIRTTTCALVFASLVPAVSQAQLALQTSGLGAVNRGMGGVAAATPVDSIGALYWNPATISALPGNEMAFGIDLIRAKFATSSSLQANSLGPGVPPVTLAGSSDSDNGWSALPSFGLVHRPEDSCLTYGLFVGGVAGFSVSYPTSTTNPVVFPQEPPPGGLPGLGSVYANLEILQIAPTIALQLSDDVSVAIGPTISLGRLQLSPGAFAAADNANGNANPSYPDATHTRFHWGGGVAGGIFYNATDDLNFGLGLRSPQWFEDLTYQSADELGRRRDFSTEFEFPMILSLGTSYTGFGDTIIGVDVRYLNWASTDLMGDPAGFAADGSLTGLGWDSTWAFAIGAQKPLTECVTVRAGYTYGKSPIDSASNGFNVVAPLLLEHVLSVGASMQISQPLTMHLAYTYAFENSVSSPIQTPVGPLPGSNVTNSISGHALTAGFTASY